MSLRWSSFSLFLLGTSAFGQDMKAGIIGNPRVGHPAPDFLAPYLTSKGAGPNDQPFHLKAELGHVVVLVFGPQRGTSRDGWEAVAAKADSGFGEKTIVIGAVRATVQQALQLTNSLGNKLKVVADSAGAAFRKFGIRGGEAKWKAFVIGDDGTVVMLLSDFKPKDPKEWSRIRQGVASGRTGIFVGAGSRFAPTPRGERRVPLR